MEGELVSGGDGWSVGVIWGAEAAWDTARDAAQCSTIYSEQCSNCPGFGLRKLPKYSCELGKSWATSPCAQNCLEKS